MWVSKWTGMKTLAYYLPKNFKLAHAAILFVLWCIRIYRIFSSITTSNMSGNSRPDKLCGAPLLCGYSIK